MSAIHSLIVTVIVTAVLGGFGPPPTREELYIQLFGSPCDCKGGVMDLGPSLGGHKQITSQGEKLIAGPQLTTRGPIDCQDKIAYLTADISAGGFSSGRGWQPQSWKCVKKPKIIPTINGKPGPCPDPCQKATELHSTCYRTVQQCTGADGKKYLTAILQNGYAGSFGGEYDYSNPRGHSKYAQASCHGQIGKAICWPPQAPIHISDGGGPTDKVREAQVQKKIEEIIKEIYPPLEYHPLALPKSRGIDLDTQTADTLKATHSALNATNPSLAENCWLCMTLGTPMPLAIPTNATTTLPEQNCTLNSPFRVQPVGFNTSLCIQKQPQNNSDDVNVGFASFTNCSQVSNYSSAICPAIGQVFVCGGNLAFTALPSNWTGLCVQASILPDIDIIPGEEPIPIPSFEYIAGHPRSKRAIQLIPLLVGLGITTAVATGTAGAGIAIHSYHKLSHQLINDVQTLSGTINDLQDQIDSLAEVVLQNRRGLDLTAEQGGICLALQEKCCFYANKSGIVRDKIKILQEDLERRRKELQKNPLWTGLNGLLPYLLPILGPLLGLLLVLSFGPWAFQKLTMLIKQQIDSLVAKPIQVHYHRLALADQGVNLY
nr:syncytin-1-like [Manis javanica]